MVNRVTTNSSDDKVSTWYIIVNADDRNAPLQNRFQSILDHIATHLATKTKPVTIFIKIDYRVVHRFKPAIVSLMEEYQYPCITPSRGRDHLES
jgi:hypothetical protein